MIDQSASRVVGGCEAPNPNREVGLSEVLYFWMVGIEYGRSRHSTVAPLLRERSRREDRREGDEGREREGIAGPGRWLTPSRSRSLRLPVKKGDRLGRKRATDLPDRGYCRGIGGIVSIGTEATVTSWHLERCYSQTG